MAKKDYWQEMCHLKHKTSDDVLLADMVYEMKKQKERESKLLKLEKTKKHYLGNKEKQNLPKPIVKTLS